MENQIKVSYNRGNDLKYLSEEEKKKLKEKESQVTESVQAEERLEYFTE